MILTEIKKERRKILLQVFVLGVCCLLLAVIGVLSSRDRFHIYMTPMTVADEITHENIGIEWTEGEMQVEKLAVNENGAVEIVVLPREEGFYQYTLTHENGEGFYYDRLQVLPGRITYSPDTKNFSGCSFAILSIALFFLGVMFLCGRQYFRYKGPLMYSYDAMLACGISLFSLVTGVSLTVLFIEHMVRPDVYNMHQVYETLGLAGGTFLIFSIPLVLVFSALVIISNIELLRHERFRIQNILGILCGGLMVLFSALGLFMQFRNFSGSLEELRRFYFINSVVCTVITYFLCILFSSVICGLRAARHVPEKDRDYILILGCKFRQDGSLTPLLKGRADKAVEFWKQQQEETGKCAILVPSGGQGNDESMAEAEAMARYLRSLGIPEDAILLEDRSKNTYQNMEFSRKKIMEQEGIPEDAKEFPPKVAYATTNYHVFRSGVWAGLADLPAEGMGSKTKWWFWPNAFIRECVGLLRNRLFFEILWLVLAVIFFGLISMQVV